MKIIVNNEDGIEEVVDSNIIRLEENDVIVVKLNTNIDKQKFELNKRLKECFPNNKIILLNNKDEINIIKSKSNDIIDNIENRKVLKG